MTDKVVRLINLFACRVCAANEVHEKKLSLCKPCWNKYLSGLVGIVGVVGDRSTTLTGKYIHVPQELVKSLTPPEETGPAHYIYVDENSLPILEAMLPHEYNEDFYYH